MIRKHTRRAAKAAFAISLGVAIVIGLFAARLARPAQRVDGGPDGHHRHEELPGGVHPRPALQAGARGEGLPVSYKENIGSTELIQTSPCTSGKINMYPEYTGVIVQDVFHQARTRRRRRTATYKLAKQLEAAKGYTLLKPTPFYDTDVLAVTNATAKKYGLKSIGDLKKVGSVQARRLPGVQDAQHLLPRLHEAVRADERVVPAARRDLGVRGARRRQGAGGRRVLDRPAARQGRRSTRCSPIRST